MARILNLRSEEEGAELSALLSACGHQVIDAPMMQMQALAPLWPDEARAVVLTSRKAATLVPDRFLPLPLYTIGPRTGEAARAAGFAGPLQHADGEYQKLLALLENAPSPLLYPSAARVRHDLVADLSHAGKQVMQVIAYAMTPAPDWSPAVIDAMQARNLDAVLLFSPDTAAAFRARLEAAGQGDATHWLPAFAMSPTIGAALGPWARLTIAPEPALSSLLASAGLLCDEARHHLKGMRHD